MLYVENIFSSRKQWLIKNQTTTTKQKTANKLNFKLKLMGRDVIAFEIDIYVFPNISNQRSILANSYFIYQL